MSLPAALDGSRALWNRVEADLSSDEVLAQLLDRGEREAWRELYRLAAGPGPEARALRGRILRLVTTVPVAFPHFWLAALRGLGEEIDGLPEPPSYAGSGGA
ncbi:MAG: hypothetical protein HY905_15690 [Deltaproteobacteria bacterium]|nr:hypothetical protein [Deltaproteobacteria bacterium]